MSQFTLAERTVDVLLDARPMKTASAEPSAAAGDDLGLDPAEFVKGAVGLGLFMTPTSSDHIGPHNTAPGEKSWKKTLDFDTVGEVRITVYKKTLNDWYIHLIFDPVSAMWSHERPNKHLYFGSGKPNYRSPEEVEDRVMRCMKWLIATLNKELSEVQSVDPNDPKIAGDRMFKMRVAAGRCADAFNKVDTALTHGSYMPDEPEPSNEVSIPARGPTTEAAALKPASKGAVDFTPDEIRDMYYLAHKFGPIFRLSAEMDKWGDSYISGSVTRTSSHYAHENTVSFDIEGDASEWFDPKTDANLTEPQYIPINRLIDSVQDMIKEHVKDISRKIYKDLEADYDYLTGEESVSDTIRANEYTFEEDGSRDKDGGFQYDQLSPEAKEKARDWYTGGGLDYEWWDSDYDHWKDRLNEMGFGDSQDDVDIAFSGFSSQGDGASFTCKRFDFKKYARYLMAGEAKDLDL